MNIPSQYRQVIYWVTFAIAATAGVAGAFDLISVEAVEKGAQAATIILGVISSLLALKNISPDE